MVFVADDLAAWLTGALADAGRKKLTALVLDTEQQRALQAAIERSSASLPSCRRMTPEDAGGHARPFWRLVGVLSGREGL